MINRKTLNIISIIIIGAGIFGMLFCLQHLWSANMADLVGVGFPFVGGSILTGTGLISLTIGNKEK